MGVRRTCAALATVLLAWASAARADPQTSIGLTLGGVVRDEQGAGASGAFHLGARGG